MKNNIDIFTQHYCPFHIIVLGVVILLISVFLIFMIPIAGIGFLVLSVLLTTSHYRLTLVPSGKKYREYLWILGFKKGTVLDYTKVEYLFINQIERNLEYGIVARLNARIVLYQAYLKLSNEKNVYIGESKSETKILQKASAISSTLKVEVVKNY